MADSNPSTNMNMPVPVVGVDPGPQYGTDIVSCLTILDSHNHSAGSGVPVTPGGLNINSDLSFANNNLTQARSLRLYPQVVALAAPTDIGCLYEVGVDLYYNDGSGNQVRITQSGGVAGSPGSIASLASPASATYVSGSSTFVWQSDVNTPANMDAAAYIFRNLSASSFGVTVSPPLALGADYSLVLPSLPASQKFMTLDASGNISAPWSVDNATLEVSSNSVRVKDAGITQAKVAIRTSASSTATAGNVALSASCAGFSSNSGSFVDVTNLSITITTLGNPVDLRLVHDGSGTPSSLKVQRTSGGDDAQMRIQILRGATVVYITVIETNILGSTAEQMNIPISSVSHLDAVAAGTYTYKVQVQVDTAASAALVENAKFLGFEIK